MRTQTKGIVASATSYDVDGSKGGATYVTQPASYSAPPKYLIDERRKGVSDTADYRGYQRPQDRSDVECL